MTILLDVLEVCEPASQADHDALNALIDDARSPADWLDEGDWLEEIIAENDREWILNG